MNLIDQLVLLATGLIAIYLIWRFYGRYAQNRAVYEIYYLGGFVVLLASGLLLLFMGYEILASPYVLTVATLIPLGISIGLVIQFLPNWSRAYRWFALLGFLAIAFTSIGGSDLKTIAVPLFHGVAGLIIFLSPFWLVSNEKAPKGFWWVGVGGALIGLGGIALSFLTVGSQLLFLSQEVVLMILAPLLLLMTLSFALGFARDLG